MKIISSFLFSLFVIGRIQGGDLPPTTFLEIVLKPLNGGGSALVCCATVNAGRVTKLSLWSPQENCHQQLKVCAAWRGLGSIHLHLNNKVNFGGFLDTIQDFEDLREVIITDSDDAPIIPWQKLKGTTNLKSLFLVPRAHAQLWLTDLAAADRLGALDTLAVHYSSDNAGVLEKFDYNLIKWMKNLNFIGTGEESLNALKLLVSRIKQTTSGISVKKGPDAGNLE